MHAHGSLRIVALVSDAEWQHHVRNALDRPFIIRWLRNDAELGPDSDLRSADVVVWHLEPVAVDASAMPSTFRRIQSAMPMSIIVLYCRVAPDVARLLLVAGRLGIDRVAFRGYDDLGRAVRDAVHERRYARAVDHIVARLELSDDRVSLVVAEVIRHAFDAPVAVEQLAREFGIDRKTLHNRLRAAGLPSPAAVISWSRLFAAGWLLDDPTRTVASIGRSLRFTSASELRGMLARYVHARPTELRQRGALNTIVEAFHAETQRARVTMSTIPH